MSGEKAGSRLGAGVARKATLLFMAMAVMEIVGESPLPGWLLDSAQARAAESVDIYLSAAVVGGFPQVRGMSLAGRGVSRSHVDDGVGGALKVGIFPQWTARAVGIELEYFGTTGKVSARTSTSGGAEGKANLAVLNSMVNLVLRKPSGVFRPYGGAGIGYSGGILYRADFPERANREFDSTPGFAYQFLGGLQWDVGARTFVFAEYKHLVTAFHWKGLSLDYRANYVLAGVGWSF